MSQTWPGIEPAHMTLSYHHIITSYHHIISYRHVRKMSKTVQKMSKLSKFRNPFKMGPKTVTKPARARASAKKVEDVKKQYHYIVFTIFLVFVRVGNKEIWNENIWKCNYIFQHTLHHDFIWFFKKNDFRFVWYSWIK